ncbi:hypothetical protein [Paenibacillus assamensis]|uniref:hypothetical protein n=1 Tax=Paenibacillus assamensis TaxID=311244 RepID=UPI0003F84A72|nr:hypothetical protein [Paenibacillus assamensis]
MKGKRYFLNTLVFACMLLVGQLSFQHTAQADYLGSSVSPSEGFESGGFTDTNFQAVSGSITEDPLKVVNGKYSAYLQSKPMDTWKEMAYTDPKNIRLERNTAYAVTFSYKAVEPPDVSKAGRYYFLVRSTDNDVSADRGWTTWHAETGTVDTKTVYFTTGNKENYYLLWGIHSGGALSLDDITIKKVSESFEKGSFTDTAFRPVSGSITSDPAKVISGKYSANLVSAPSQQWSEFAYSDPKRLKFEPYTTYSVTFSYKASKDGSVDDQYYYFLARSSDDDVKADIGWTTWKAKKNGDKGTKTVTFTTGQKENYYLIWGIHNGGEISLDDIHMKKRSESFERGTYSDTDYEAWAGTITNEADKVISGTYSAYLASPTSLKWNEFSYSNSKRVKFEKNTRYQVSFSYKAIVAPPAESDSFYYFLVRSADNDRSADLGFTSWTGETGKGGKKTITFTTGDKDNYYLIWGIHNGGAMSLDDVKIDRAHYTYDKAGRLLQHYISEFQSIYYNYDQNGNLVDQKRVYN